MKSKKEHLHVEIIDGELYLYIDNNPRKGLKVTREDMNYQCNICPIKEGTHIIVPLPA